MNRKPPIISRVRWKWTEQRTVWLVSPCPFNEEKRRRRTRGTRRDGGEKQSNEPASSSSSSSSRAGCIDFRFVCYFVGRIVGEISLAPSRQNHIIEFTRWQRNYTLTLGPWGTHEMRRRGSLAIGQINAATLANRGLGNYRANSSLTQADFTCVSFSVQRARVRLCTCNNKFFFHLISHSSSRDGKTHNRHTNITSCTCIILGLST